MEPENAPFSCAVYIDGIRREFKIKSLGDLFVFADPLLYFKKEGQQTYPSIALLARITLSRCDNGAFQESVFSSASDTKDSSQTAMNTDQFEKRALLFHNKKYITCSMDNKKH